MARPRVRPVYVTAGEWRYLQKRFADPVAAQEARARIDLCLQRLVKRGNTPQQLHEAIMRGTQVWQRHQKERSEQATRHRHRELVDKARADLERALSSLRRLLPDSLRKWDDEEVWRVRDMLLQVPGDDSQRGRGRPPARWKQETDAALRALRVPVTDRRELIAALGFDE